MSKPLTRTFEELLAESAAAHGHLCPGQVLGVRLAMLGLALLGYQAPLDEKNIKKVVIFVEIDRCAADALTVAAGVRLGRRSLKFKDFGLMAATFVNLPDGRAYRVSVREECRAKAAGLLGHILDQREREIEAYQRLSAEELFMVESVEVDLRPEDLPGWRGDKAVCDRCGAVIRHRREVRSNGLVLCQVCAGPTYFTKVTTLSGINNLDPVKPTTKGKDDV